MLPTPIERDDYPTAAELARLAVRAAERGVVVERTATAARAYDPDRRRWFDLTAYSCTCRRFLACGACQHHAALTAAEEPAFGCPVCGEPLMHVGDGLLECPTDGPRGWYHGTYTVADLTASAAERQAA